MKTNETSHVWGIVQEWLDAQWNPPSQAKIAQRLGVAKSTVSAWKHGQTRPQPEDLKQLAVLCGVPLERLIDADLRDAGLRGDGAQSTAV